jgi:hypothetical protein
MPEPILVVATLAAAGLTAVGVVMGLLLMCGK